MTITIVNTGLKFKSVSQAAKDEYTDIFMSGDLPVVFMHRGIFFCVT
jgi:hypothetical protein